MAVTTVTKTIGTTGTFSTLALWESGAPANLTTSNNWSAGTFLVGAFIQGEVVTGTGITGGKMLDTDSTGAGTGTYITFGTTTTPAAGITVTGSTSLATCVLSGSADVGVIWQGQCQNQEFSGTGVQCTISGSTVSSTCYKELTAVAGASFRDNANVQTNALYYNASNGCGIKGTTDSTRTISIQENNVSVNKLQVAATGNSGHAIHMNSDAGFLNFLICEGNDSDAGTANGVISQGAGVNNVIANSLIIQRKSGAEHIIGTGTSTVAYYNCTIVAPDDLATAPTEIFNSGVSGTVTVQNCGLFAGNSTKAITAGSATFNFTTCYSDISGTTGVTQCTYANQFQNVNDATRDFRLKAGANMLDTGTTDSTNAANDIVGTARPQGSAYDVGCWEKVVAASSQYWCVCADAFSPQTIAIPY